MRDPGDPFLILTGADEILEGAIKYIQGCARPREEEDWDSDHARYFFARLRQLRKEALGTIAEWTPADAFTEEEFL